MRFYNPNIFRNNLKENCKCKYKTLSSFFSSNKCKDYVCKNYLLMEKIKEVGLENKKVQKYLLKFDNKKIFDAENCILFKTDNFFTNRVWIIRDDLEDAKLLKDLKCEEVNKFKFENLLEGRKFINVIDYDIVGMASYMYNYFVIKIKTEENELEFFLNMYVYNWLLRNKKYKLMFGTYNITFLQDNQSDFVGAVAFTTKKFFSDRPIIYFE